MNKSHHPKGLVAFEPSAPVQPVTYSPVPKMTAFIAVFYFRWKYQQEDFL